MFVELSGCSACISPIICGSSCSCWNEEECDVLVPRCKNLNLSWSGRHVQNVANSLMQVSSPFIGKTDPLSLKYQRSKGKGNQHVHSNGSEGLEEKEEAKCV